MTGGCCCLGQWPDCPVIIKKHGMSWRLMKILVFYLNLFKNAFFQIFLGFLGNNFEESFQAFFTCLKRNADFCDFKTPAIWAGNITHQAQKCVAQNWWFLFVPKFCLWSSEQLLGQFCRPARCFEKCIQAMVSLRVCHYFNADYYPAPSEPFRTYFHWKVQNKQDPRFVTEHWRLTHPTLDKHWGH